MCCTRRRMETSRQKGEWTQTAWRESRSVRQPRRPEVAYERSSHQRRILLDESRESRSSKASSLEWRRRRRKRRGCGARETRPGGGGGGKRAAKGVRRRRTTEERQRNRGRERKRGREPDRQGSHVEEEEPGVMRGSCGAVGGARRWIESLKTMESKGKRD